MSKDENRARNSQNSALNSLPLSRNSDLFSVCCRNMNNTIFQSPKYIAIISLPSGTIGMYIRLVVRPFIPNLLSSYVVIRSPFVFDEGLLFFKSYYIRPFIIMYLGSLIDQIMNQNFRNSYLLTI